jgi:hypothetical protein
LAAAGFVASRSKNWLTQPPNQIGSVFLARRSQGRRTTEIPSAGTIDSSMSEGFSTPNPLAGREVDNRFDSHAI